MGFFNELRKIEKAVRPSTILNHLVPKKAENVVRSVSDTVQQVGSTAKEVMHQGQQMLNKATVSANDLTAKNQQMLGQVIATAKEMKVSLDDAIKEAQEWRYMFQSLINFLDENASLFSLIMIISFISVVIYLLYKAVAYDSFSAKNKSNLVTFDDKTVVANLKSQKIITADTESVQYAIPGLSYQKISEAGHCLYNAVAIHVGQDQFLLRKIVALHLKNNLEKFSGVIAFPKNKKIADYLNDIRAGIEWADHIEIEVLMHVLERPILVIGSNGKIRNLDDRIRFARDPIFVYYNGRDHYDGFLRKKEYSIQAILNQITELVERLSNNQVMNDPHMQELIDALQKETQEDNKKLLENKLRSYAYDPYYPVLCKPDTAIQSIGIMFWVGVALILSIGKFGLPVSAEIIIFTAMAYMSMILLLGAYAGIEEIRELVNTNTVHSKNVTETIVEDQEVKFTDDSTISVDSAINTLREATNKKEVRAEVTVFFKQNNNKVFTKLSGGALKMADLLEDGVKNKKYNADSQIQVDIHTPGCNIL